LNGALGYYRDSQPGDHVGRLALPSLLVAGTTDIIEPGAFERSKEMFDGPIEVAVAEGAGHWPHREAPEFFHERLLAFLAGLPVD
jgi:pimeloyl-ACP methyl ester carboxylesterase